MKSLAHKLIAFSFILSLAAGCASVTDAGLDAQPEQPAIEQPQPDGPGFGSDQDMSPIIEKPE